jgi:hypothetical protein
MGAAIAEIKALASYPEELLFVWKYPNRWARIENSVPLLFMRAIAEHIRQDSFCDLGLFDPKNCGIIGSVSGDSNDLSRKSQERRYRGRGRATSS